MSHLLSVLPPAEHGVHLLCLQLDVWIDLQILIDHAREHAGLQLPGHLHLPWVMPSVGTLQATLQSQSWLHLPKAAGDVGKSIEIL